MKVFYGVSRGKEHCPMERIFIVEDDLKIRSELSALLTKYG